jgi:glucokinase
VAITNFLYTFDPTVVVLGGGVTKAGHLLFGPVISTVHSRTPQAYWEHCDIVKAALGEDVGLMGALALYLSARGD